MAESKRIAHRNRRLANQQFGRVAQFNRRQGFVAGNFQHGQVGFRIGADEIRRQFPAIGKLHGDLPCPIDHMIVRDHITIGVNDESATQ